MLNGRLKIFVVVVLPIFAAAQRINIDSLVQQSSIEQNDTLKLIRVRAIARSYAELNPDSAYHYSEISLEFARMLKLKLENLEDRESNYHYLNQQHQKHLNKFRHMKLYVRPELLPN